MEIYCSRCHECHKFSGCELAVIAEILLTNLEGGILPPHSLRLLDNRIVIQVCPIDLLAEQVFGEGANC